MNTSRKNISSIAEVNKQTFSVLTYNILADCHVIGWEHVNYPFVNEENLLKKDGENSSRHHLLMKELNHFDSDVILLQEVEVSYSPIL